MTRGHCSGGWLRFQGDVYDGMANIIAAKYYGVSTHDVARYAGQHVTRIRTLRRIRS